MCIYLALPRRCVYAIWIYERHFAFLRIQWKLNKQVRSIYFDMATAHVYLYFLITIIV